METSPEIRRKLALVIGNLIRRCIHEARMVPYILSREEVVNILVDDPSVFEKLVMEEEADRAAYSKVDLTVKLDAAAELGKLEALESFEKSFWSESEVDVAPILDLTNQLTRTFAVYIGNASTLFDKSFEEFMNKFRRSLQRSGLMLKAIDFTREDVGILRENAAAYLSAGEFLQAFTFDRLLDSQVMIDQVVHFPPEGRKLREDLLRQALSAPGRAAALVKFVLRISYISQGAWEDLFAGLVKIAHRDSFLCAPGQLIDLIEKDVVFLCNLLRASYADLRQWPPALRRQAIEGCLERYRAGA